MASSSLKKMRGAQEWKEGNYASLKTTPWDRFIGCDLGLTLLPGSQIHRKDETKLRAAAEGNPKRSLSKYARGSGKWNSAETETQQKCVTQETAFPDKALSPSSSSDLPPEPARLSHLTPPRSQKRRFSRSISVKDGSEVVQHKRGSFTAVSYPAQRMGTGEIGNDNNCQHEAPLPRALKQRKLVSKGNEVAFETHCNNFHVHRNQDLPEINVVRSQRGEHSAASIRSPPSGIGGDLESSKPEQRRQATHSLNPAPARPHQGTIIGSEDTTALHGSPSVLGALASGSRAKHRVSEPEEVAVHYRALNPSQFISTHQWKHRRLFPHTAGDIGTKLSKPRKEVNRSWTTYFPAKAKSSRCANLPAPSLLAAQFTPSQEYQHPYPNIVPLTSTNLQAYTHFSSTLPSSALPIHLSLPKPFDRPLDACTQEKISDIAHAGICRQSAPRRSASMPTLSSTRAPMNMASSNSFGPTSMPTPPREQPSSPECLPCSSSPSSNPFREYLVGPPRANVDTPFNADNFPSQNWHFNPNSQSQRETSLPNKQSLGFASRLEPPQVSTQYSNHQDMISPSGSKDDPMAIDEPQFRRRRLEVKSNYSSEEVKSLMSNFVRQAQILQAENSNLQSLNAAMGKGFEGLRRGNAESLQQIQRYERIIAQKDQQLEAMRQKSYSIQQRFKRIWEERNQLFATMRKEHGIGNPSELAKKIRLNHSLNACRGSQPSTNVSPVLCANEVQIPMSRHGFEQTPTGFQGHVQQVSLSGPSEANVTNTSSRLSRQQGSSATKHNNADLLQTVSIPAHSETNVTKASSQALSQLGFAAANYDEAKLPQDESNRWVHLNQPLGAIIKTATSSGQNNHPTEPVPTERVIIDLTHDSQLPSSLASCHTLDIQARQPSVRIGYPLFDISPAQYPAEHFVSSQYASGSSAQKQMSQNQLALDQDSQSKNLEAMRIQKEAFTRMAEKPLSWLQGENPFRKGTKPQQQAGSSISSQPSESNAEEPVLFAKSPGANSVAPLPEIATGRTTKKKGSKKTRALLDAEAKKERAKGYRKTAAEKKKRDKEIAQQMLQNKNVLNIAMRAQKQDRGAAKGCKRQEQGQKRSEELGPQDPQKTLDGRLYQEDTAVQQATRGGSMEQAASDDRDSLFGDSEAEGLGYASSADADSVMHDDSAVATQQDIDAAYVAEIEAEFEADVDAERMAGVEQGDVFSGQTSVPNGDDGNRDFPSESEESEEE